MKTKMYVEPYVSEFIPPSGHTHNTLPWHVKAMSKFEMWYLSKFYNINPEQDRIVRFYTVENRGIQDHSFKCPSYYYDSFDNLYEDFVEASCKIGDKLSELFSVSGEYYYDVKITLEYFKIGNPIDGYDWDMSYSWKVLKTNNPRCSLGCSTTRKDCSQLHNRNSKLEICGYKLSGKYNKFADLLEDLSHKTIIIHSKSDAAAVLRVVKYLGVSTVNINGKHHTNIPSKYNYFTDNTFGYQVSRNLISNCLEVTTITRNNMPESTHEVLDVDELIVKRSLKSWLRDR